MEELTESIQTKEWLGYKQGLEKRNREKKEQLKKKFNLYLSYVEKVASMLYQDFNVKKVYLIGSLLDFNWFHKYSDIDIAVEGLDPGEYFQAYLRIEKITDGERFHLIDMKDINDEFIAKIREKGKLLHTFPLKVERL